MEIEYELTKEDLYAFHWRSAYSSPRARRMAWKPYLVLFIVVLLVSLMGGIGADATFSFVHFSLLFAVFPIVALATWLTTRITMRRFINQILKEEKPERGQLGKHRVVLEDSGLVESTSVNESSRSWAGIDRIEQDSNYIYIYTAPLMAIIIPKRGFKDVTTAEAFYELSEARRSAAA